nr:hypothetical protein [Tanacetum cinerariifolium]
FVFDSQFGYDCQPQFPLPYESKHGYNENYPYPYDSSSLPQQYLCCARCGEPHMNYQCQPMNQDSYNSNSLGFDQPQPPQSPVNHPIFNAHNDPLISQTTLNEQMTQLTSMCEIFCQFVQKKQEEKRFEKEQAAKAQTWKLSDDDDDEESFNSLNDNIFELPSFSAITPDEPVLSTEEPDNSLSMRDEHIDTIPATELEKFIKSGVENLIPIPSESEDCYLGSRRDQSNPIISGTPPNLTPSGESEFFSEVDAFLAVEDESTSSQFPKSDLDPEGAMLLFEAFLNDDHSSNSQTKSSSTSLNSLLEETHNFDNSLPEITTFSNDPCDAECESDDQSYSDEDVLEKIVSLFDEFAGELTLLKSIPPGIDETDCHPEEEIYFSKRLLYDNSSPRPPEEFVSANSDAAIKSFSPSPISIKDSDSLMEEMDLFCTLDYPMQPGIEDKDVVEDISSTKEPPVLNTLPTHPTLQLNMKFQPSSEYLFAYVVWIFLPFLVYSVVPCYLLSLRNEDI